MNKKPNKRIRAGLPAKAMAQRLEKKQMILSQRLLRFLPIMDKTETRTRDLGADVNKALGELEKEFPDRKILGKAEFAISERIADNRALFGKLRKLNASAKRFVDTGGKLTGKINPKAEKKLLQTIRRETMELETALRAIRQKLGKG